MTEMIDIVECLRTSSEKSLATRWYQRACRQAADHIERLNAKIDDLEDQINNLHGALVDSNDALDRI